MSQKVVSACLAVLPLIQGLQEMLYSFYILYSFNLKVILKTQQSFSFHYPSENAYALDLAEDRSDNSG